MLELKFLNNWNKEHQVILDKIKSLAEMPDEIYVQKSKFTLLSDLLLKLCTSRNVKSSFKDLTSLIILFLNMYRKNYPIDVYSGDIKGSQLKPEDNLNIKRIIRQELINSNPNQ